MADDERDAGAGQLPEPTVAVAAPALPLEVVGQGKEEDDQHGQGGEGGDRVDEQEECELVLDEQEGDK
jgi:hypothetical protein